MVSADRGETGTVGGCRRLETFGTRILGSASLEVAGSPAAARSPGPARSPGGFDDAKTVRRLLSFASPDASVSRLLFGNRTFLSVWGTGGLVGIVRWLQFLVLGIHTFEITGSPLLVSLIPLLWMLPLALCGPLIGVFADRSDRKMLVLVSLAIALAFSVAMAVAAAHASFGFWPVALASFVGGMLWATDIPVRRRLLGDVTKAEDLATAMSLDSAASSSTRMFGPVLGGVVLQFFSLSGVFILSAILFALCLVAIASIPSAAKDARKPRVRSGHLFGELISGFRFVIEDARLRWILSITIVFNLWGFPFTSMIPVIGADILGLAPALIGLLSSSEGLGAFIGAIVLALFARPRQFVAIYHFGTVLYLLLIGVLGLICHSFSAGVEDEAGSFAPFLVAMVILSAIGVAGACFSAMQSALSYLNAPAEYRSRILGALTLCIGTGPIGFLHIGWLAENFGPATAFLINAGEGLLALSILRRWSGGAPASMALVSVSR